MLCGWNLRPDIYPFSDNYFFDYLLEIYDRSKDICERKAPWSFFSCGIGAFISVNTFTRFHPKEGNYTRVLTEKRNYLFGQRVSVFQSLKLVVNLWRLKCQGNHGLRPPGIDSLIAYTQQKVLRGGWWREENGVEILFSALNCAGCAGSVFEPSMMKELWVAYLLNSSAYAEATTWS